MTVYRVRIEDQADRLLKERAKAKRLEPDEYIVQIVEDYFLAEARSRMIERSVSWYGDWYARMLALWGAGFVGHTVRLITYRRLVPLAKKAKVKLSEPPLLTKAVVSLLEYTADEFPDAAASVVEKSADKRTATKILWPMDWYEFMTQTWGDGMVAHNVKAGVRDHIDPNRELQPLRKRGGVE